MTSSVQKMFFSLAYGAGIGDAINTDGRLEDVARSSLQKMNTGIVMPSLSASNRQGFPQSSSPMPARGLRFLSSESPGARGLCSPMGGQRVTEPQFQY